MNEKTTEKARDLMTEFSTKWLCNKLGVTAPTLYRRLNGDKSWKFPEIALIEDLHARTMDLKEAAKELGL